MNQIHTMLLDRKASARQQLARMLMTDRRIRIVAQCSGYRDGLVAIERLAPDLLFLDAQLPDESDCNLLTAAGPRRLPHVVFVTGNDDNVTRTFEVNAIDYLLTPVDVDRLRITVERAVSRINGIQEADYLERLQSALAGLRVPPAR